MWKPLIKQVHTHLTWFQRSVLKGNVPFCGVLFWPCLILYFNKEKDCLWWKESWDLNLELTVFSPFLPLPGGQQLVLWLTAAPPSVCRPLTYWVDKHPRASGVLPTWPCTCLHIAQCLCGRRTGQSSLAQQALPSCPVEGRGGGTAELSGNVMIELQSWTAFTLPPKLEYILPQMKDPLSSVFFFSCERVSYANYLVSCASPNLESQVSIAWRTLIW